MHQNCEEVDFFTFMVPLQVNTFSWEGLLGACVLLDMVEGALLEHFVENDVFAVVIGQEL